ncbi:TPA: hypothetical protein ACRMUJ_005178 [Pseudomonas aeruginosa]|nr:hypothetical protein [Pseudomonas aeruginosa]HBN8446453.1 hypothetical protein [Pseudomonas aeruginosa]HCL3325757.1 hypothetical protein [Pseudomonas aeruginosa]
MTDLSQHTPMMQQYTAAPSAAHESSELQGFYSNTEGSHKAPLKLIFGLP